MWIWMKQPETLKCPSGPSLRFWEPWRGVVLFSCSHQFPVPALAVFSVGSIHPPLHPAQSPYFIARQPKRKIHTFLIIVTKESSHTRIGFQGRFRATYVSMLEHTRTSYNSACIPDPGGFQWLLQICFQFLAMLILLLALPTPSFSYPASPTSVHSWYSIL